MIKKLFLILFSSFLFAQTGGVNVPVYTAAKETALVAAAEVLTIRKPSTTNRSAFLLDAYLYCSVACTVTLEKMGTYSSGNTVTPVPGRDSWGAAEILATSSTSIASTTPIITYYLAAGADKALDLRGMYLVDSLESITLRTNSITGTVVLSVRWESRN